MTRRAAVLRVHDAAPAAVHDAAPAAAPDAPPTAAPAAVTASTLEAFGLTVTERIEATYTVQGNTRPLRTVMRELGGSWDRVSQRWVFVGADPRPAIEDRLRSPHGPGLSDSAAPFDAGGPPNPNAQHYRGHRQRLRDRFLKGDDEGLPDYELLELLLFFGIGYIDTKPLAKALLQEFGSLGGVLNVAPERLTDFNPFWEAKEKSAEQTARDQHFLLVLFRAVRVFAARLAREDTAEGTVLTKWDKLISYLRASMAHRKTEQFRVLFLDRRNVLIADEVQNEGSIDHTPVYPREVVKRALTLDASAVIMVHNHPSNHPAPSEGDIEMTRLVRQALTNVGVVLHDHLIVSRSGHTSFKQLGLL
jgi:DNA repair protein RadC